MGNDALFSLLQHPTLKLAKENVYLNCDLRGMLI